jgi:ATP-binding cassette subfamily B protein
MLGLLEPNRGSIELILKDAPILLFDEITSCLDQAIEVRIMESIKSLTNITCFIVSHRELLNDLVSLTLNIK